MNDANRETILALAKECGFKFGLKNITCDESAIMNLVMRVHDFLRMQDAMCYKEPERVDQKQR